MKIICLECQREISEKFPFDDPRPTHTICPECIDKNHSRKRGLEMANPQSRNYIIDMKTGFYNRRFFNIRLREERRRTERSGSPFSVLKLDISGLADSIEKQPKLKIHQMKKVVTKIIRENTRDIDIKSWHDDTTLKILMPQTPKSGADSLAEKLREKVNDALRTFFGLKSVFDLKKNMIITSYPEVMKNSGEPSESKPSVTKKPMASSPVRWANKKVNRSNKKIKGHKKEYLHDFVIAPDRS